MGAAGQQIPSPLEGEGQDGGCVIPPTLILPLGGGRRVVKEVSDEGTVPFTERTARERRTQGDGPLYGVSARSAEGGGAASRRRGLSPGEESGAGGDSPVLPMLGLKRPSHSVSGTVPRDRPLARGAVPMTE